MRGTNGKGVFTMTTTTSKNLSRRGFMKRGLAAAAAGPLIVSASALGRELGGSANDRVNVGCIGVGRRCNQLMRMPRGMEIVALADCNIKRIRERAEGEDWKCYQDYREMLARDDIDAVIIASPDHWHTLHAIDAIEAGKDVYVEKPMTLTIKEGQALVKAARKHGRIVQVGSQQRSERETWLGCQLIRNRMLGEVSVIHGANYPSPWECPLPEEDAPDYIDWDAWCGQTTPRGYHIELYTPRVRGQAAGWISYRPYSGGEITGWGAHGLDMIQWALGYEKSGPVAVEPLLDKVPAPDGEHMGPRCQVKYTYAGGEVLILDDIGPGGGGVFDCAEGKMMLTRGKYQVKGKDISDADIEAADIQLYKSTDHMGNWHDCIRSRELPIADVEQGHRSTTMCHLGNIARWAKRPLKWDPEAEQFAGDDEANTYLAREMRKPYYREDCSA